MRKEVCDAIARLHENVVAAFLVQDEAIVEWSARPDIAMPDVHEMEAIMMQRLIMVSLAKNHEMFLGRLHCIAGRYDDSDILLFGQDTDAKSMLVVRIKRPYRMEALAEKITRILARREKEEENVQ